MSQTAARARQAVLDFLKDPATGLNFELSGIASRDSVILPPIHDSGWFAANIADDVLDKNFDAAPYPCALVSLGSSRNENVQKFRYFSGPHEVVVEVRLSVEGFPELVGLEENLDRYVEAALNVLQSPARQWHNQAVQYNGEYTVAYSAVRTGGLNFIQSAQIKLKMHQHS